MYKSLKEFREKEPEAYKSAVHHNMVENICYEMGWEKELPSYWVRETIIEDAKKYKSKKEWRKHNQYAHDKATRMGIMDEIINLCNFKVPIKRNDVLPFEEAREFVCGLNLKNTSEWKNYLKSGGLPANIPTNPNIIYKNKGWLGINHWLGMEKYLSFNYAKRLIQKNETIKTKSDFINCKQNNLISHKIPINPEVIYKNEGWISWDDFLIYSEPKVINYLSFYDAKNYCQKLNLRTVTQWSKYIEGNQLPTNIPRYPNLKYKNEGWISWEDFLQNYYSFNKIKSILINDSNITTKKEYKNAIRSGYLNNRFPIRPDVKYKNKGWLDWGDFLNGSSKSTIEYYTLDEAKKFISENNPNIRWVKDYKEWVRSNQNITRLPIMANEFYKNKGWISWKDFFNYTPPIKKKKSLNTISIIKKPVTPPKPKLSKVKKHTRKMQYISFEDARAFVWTLNLNTYDEWLEYYDDNDLPINIPKKAGTYYHRKGDWISRGDWLGTTKGKRHKGMVKKVTYKEASKIAIENGITNSREWWALSRTDDKLPRHPNRVYKNKGWVSWDDFLELDSNRTKTQYPTNYWSDKNNIFKDIDKYESFIDWNVNEYRAYEAARRLNYIDEIKRWFEKNT